MSRKKRMQNVREAKDRRTKKLAIGGGSRTRGRARLPDAAHARRRQQGGCDRPRPRRHRPGHDAATPDGDASGHRGPPPPCRRRGSSTKLPNSDAAPARSKSQLYSFSHFSGKDPFVPAVSRRPRARPPERRSGTSTGPTTGPLPPRHRRPRQHGERAQGARAAEAVDVVVAHARADRSGDDLGQRQGSRRSGSAQASRARTRSSGSSRSRTASRGSASPTAPTRAARRPSRSSSAARSRSWTRPTASATSSGC